LITAIVVIGRSGSAFAAEIGNHEGERGNRRPRNDGDQSHPLSCRAEVSGHGGNAPCLTIWANAMGILGGSLFGVVQADFTFLRYLHASIDSLLLRDITTGLVKSVMFGITSPLWDAWKDCPRAQELNRLAGPPRGAVVMSNFSRRCRGFNFYCTLLFRRAADDYEPNA